MRVNVVAQHKVTVAAAIEAVVDVAPTIAVKIAPQRVRTQAQQTIVALPRTSSLSARHSHEPKQASQARIAHATIATVAAVVVTVAKRAPMCTRSKWMALQVLLKLTS
jgi:hypothetical protein